MFRRTFLLLIIFALTPLIILTLTYYSYYSSVINKELNTGLINRINDVDNIIEKTLADKASDVLSWSRMSIPALCFEYNRPEAMEVFLTKLMDTYQIYSHIIAYTNHRSIFAADKKTLSEAIGFTLAKTDIGHSLGSEERANITLDDLKGRHYVVITSPIRNRLGEILGYLSAYIDWRKIEELIHKRDNMSLIKPYVEVDELFFNDKIKPINSLASKIANVGIIDSALNDSGNVKAYENGTDVFMISCVSNDTLLSNGNLVECISVKKDDMLSSLKYIRNIALIIAVTAIAVVAFISLIIAKKVVKPFKEIVTILAKYRNRDANAVPEDKTSDNIYTLKKNIVKLINQLVNSERKVCESAHFATIGQISSHIAHDMRSPLSVLKGYVKTSTQSDDAEIKEYQGAAQRSVDKLLHMADDLVDYAKASKIERSNQDVNKLITGEVITEIKKTAKKQGINVRYDTADKITANIDPYRIERVLVNIINNGLDAVSAGGQVVVRTESKDDKDIVITITDNGKGISDEDLPHIFDSFFTKGKKSGTGLGLSYCKQVVEAHGGTIDVESEEGKGTKFTIRIQDCVEKAEAEDRIFRNEPEIKCDGRRFILIDDDADIRLRWRKIVQENGGTVVGEANCFENMNSNGGLNYHEADVAIVDYNFEGSDKTGIDVIAYLRAKGINEIHLCTGFADDHEVRAAAFTAGATSVIPKEFS